MISVKGGGGGENVRPETDEYTALLAEAISEIEGKAALGGDATAEDIREGKTAYVNGQLLEGLMKEGITGLDCGEVTLNTVSPVTINHKLNKIPSEAYLIPKFFNDLSTGVANQTYANFNGTIVCSAFLGSAYGPHVEAVPNTMTDKTVSFGAKNTNGFIAGTYLWIVKE